MSQMSGMGSSFGFSAPLNYGSGAPNMFSGYGTAGYPSQLGAAYSQQYGQALQANQQNYNNIIAGYGNLQNAAGQAWGQLPANVLAGGANVGQAYGQLGQQVQGQIQGVQQSALMMNTNAFQQQLAAIQAQAQNAGLGMTSQPITPSLDATQQYGLANTATMNQFAQLEAGYMSQLGSAGIQAYQTANQQAAGYAAEGIQAQTGIGLQQLGFMAGINIPYPNASAYSQALQGSSQYQLAQQQLARGSGGGSSAPGQAASSPQDSTSFGAGGGYGYSPFTGEYGFSPNTYGGTIPGSIPGAAGIGGQGSGGPGGTDAQSQNNWGWGSGDFAGNYGGYGPDFGGYAFGG